MSLSTSCAAEGLAQVPNIDDAFHAHASSFDASHADGRAAVGLRTADDVVVRPVHLLFDEAQDARHREGEDEVDHGDDEERFKITVVKAGGGLALEVQLCDGK